MIANSRPLHAVYNDTQYELLTPSHFLNPQTPLNAPIPEDGQCSTENPSANSAAEKLILFWKRTKHYYAQLWQHWRKHYLLELRDTPRYNIPNPKSTCPLNIAPGDIVHVLDKKTKTGNYSKTDIMTKITEVVELTVSKKLRELHEKLEGIQLQTMLDNDTLIINNGDRMEVEFNK